LSNFTGLNEKEENTMDDVEKLLKTSLVEIERVLNTKTVVGDPIKIDDTTLIPLLSVGFGFGAGGGTGKGDLGAKTAGSGEGAGAGVGGGGGVKPVAMIVIDSTGVRVESIKGGTASAMEAIGAVIGKAVESGMKKDKESA
jgi:uncharacterized spore protein YtfJ